MYPNVLTLSAVLDAVPLEDGDPAVAVAGGSERMLFDVTKVLLTKKQKQTTSSLDLSERFDKQCCGPLLSRHPPPKVVELYVTNFTTLIIDIVIVAKYTKLPAEPGEGFGGKEWAGFGAYEATEFMLDKHINETTGMSKMNPGLDVHRNVSL